MKKRDFFIYMHSNPIIPYLLLKKHKLFNFNIFLDEFQSIVMGNLAQTKQTKPNLTKSNFLT